MKQVLILFGGASNEHDVSLLSASSVIAALDRTKYEPVLVGITKQGGWFYYTGDPALLPEDNWLKQTNCLTPAILSPDTEHHGILLLREGKAELRRVDVCFPVLHGKNGEDGTMQGLLTMAGIPFVGCDLLSSAMCMDKAVTNMVMDSCGFAQAKWRAFTRHEFVQNAHALLREAADYLGFPLFVKPANAGSSVGVTKVKAFDALRAAVEEAFLHDGKALLEEGIDGIEAECAVLGNEQPIASVVGEVAPSNEFYDYAAKYIDNKSELYIPARFATELQEQIREKAIGIYHAMGCAGLARVDFFVRRGDNALLINELNTVPGFTSISMYLKLFDAAGIPYAQLIDRLLCLAMEK